MVILGGMGRTGSVVVAAIVLTLLPEVLRQFSDYRHDYLLAPHRRADDGASSGAFCLPAGGWLILEGNDCGTDPEVQNATIRFGGLTAVSDLNLEIGRDELVGLIGPNGAEDDGLQPDHWGLSAD